jgi:hypothetical protein
LIDRSIVVVVGILQFVCNLFFGQFEVDGGHHLVKFFGIDLIGVFVEVEGLEDFDEVLLIGLFDCVKGLR